MAVSITDSALLAACVGALVACGGAVANSESSSGKSKSEPAADTSQDQKPAQQPAEAPLAGVPQSCAKQTDSGYCLPGEQFVRKLCDGVYADVALVMFKDGTPWTRAYLTRKTDAWNASGGASVQGELAFDEEVLVLRERASKAGGIQVSGAMGSYDALRWNGSCVSLMSEEITTRRPPKLLHSRVEWKWLSGPMQEALRTNSAIVEAYRARRSECKGVSLGEVTKKCEQLDTKLVEVIVRHVREGGTVAEAKFP